MHSRPFPLMSSISPQPPPRPLKVCCTCRYWTKKYKGFCDRLGQAVGKFHICAGWEDEAALPEAQQTPEMPAAKAGRA